MVRYSREIELDIYIVVALDIIREKEILTAWLSHCMRGDGAIINKGSGRCDLYKSVKMRRA